MSEQEAKTQQPQQQPQPQKPKTRYQYNGSHLSESIRGLMKEPEKQITADLKKEQVKPSPKAKVAVVSRIVSEKPLQLIGYRKVFVTITEREAQYILNYAGFSKAKKATIQVWFAEGKEPIVDPDVRTISPVGPL
jgi:hypothetical protein